LVSHDALIQTHKQVLDLIPRVAWLGHKVQRRFKKLTNLGTFTKPEAKSHYGLAIKYDRLIEQIWSLEDSESFLQPNPFAKLVPACASGSVVIINVHESACDTLILYWLGNIVCVPLPVFSYEKATSMY
jgi:hypothetical protein